MTAVNLIETVCASLQRAALPAEKLLLVGVSGGTDSLALLHILAALRARLGLRLHAATLDHGLRGDAGAADARFVVAAAQALGVPVSAGCADVRALAAERGLGIEAAARLARYDYLASVAREIGAQHVAVAHNADDQAETVLFHLLRGASLSGLAGMSAAAPLPGHPDLTLIRPLLTVPRVDLEAYCRAHDLQPRHDLTNEDTSYTRNRLRRELLPYLREYVPQLDRRLLQLAEIAALEDDFADQALHAAIDTYVIHSADWIALPRKVFITLHPALQRRFVVWAARQLGADDAGYVHVTAAVRLALHGEVGGRAQLKRGIQFRVTHDAVVMELQSRQQKPADMAAIPQGLEIPINIPGRTKIDGRWLLTASLTPWEVPGLRLVIPQGASVLLRGRRNGDRFSPLGLKGHVQKLSKWLIDHQVPRELRDQLPLIVVDGELAALFVWTEWVVSEHFAVKPGSERIVYFRLSRDG